jgi:hypothetical protein
MAAKFIKITFILITAFLIHSCSKDNNPVIPENKIVFGLYYLKDSTLKTYNISTENPDTLKLQDKPFLSNLDIDYYDYSSHCVYLKKKKNEIFPFEDDLDLTFQPFIDRPFVAMASGKICYVGYFRSFVYGYRWKEPELYTLENCLNYPEDILHINWAEIFENDKRNNDLIKKTLLDNNLFHAGIKVEITNIVIIPSDTTTVEYSITITNNDSYNLYVLDPEKTGVALFNYYTNGPYFYKVPSDRIITSNRKLIQTPDPYDSWKPEWFTKIESNSFLKRTIKLKGYPNIPYDNYLVNFKYIGPIKTMEKNIRLLPDGRYWIGYIYSGIINVQYKNDGSCEIY